jgi:hypothetical protein
MKWKKRKKKKRDADEAWNLDELSVQELLERLQYHHNTVKRSFDKDEADVRGIIDNIRDEADTLKKMLATASITDMDANAELLEFINKMEHELSSRNVFDTRLATAEEDLAASLNDLYDHLGPKGPKQPSHTMAEEMTESKSPDNYSDTLDILLDLVQSTQKFAKATVRIIDSEENRRNQSKLRNPRDTELLAAMNALRSTERNTWDSVDALSKGLSIYAASVVGSPDALANVEEEMKGELAAGVPSSQLREVMEVFAKKFLYPTETVYSAIHALLDIYADVQADLGQLRDEEMDRREVLADLLTSKRKDLEDEMKKAGQVPGAESKGEKVEFDGDVEKFVALREANELSEFTQMLELSGDRQVLEEQNRLTGAKSQLMEDASSANLSDADARQLINAFQQDQKLLDRELRSEQKLAQSKALRRFEHMREDRKAKNAKKAAAAKTAASRAKHEEEIAQIREEFQMQALEKLESTKLEAMQLAERQQRDMQLSTEQFAIKEADILNSRQQDAVAQLESPDHVQGKTLQSEQANELRRADQRIGALFDDLKERLIESTDLAVKMVDTDPNISNEEKSNLKEDILAEKKLEKDRLEEEEKTLVTAEKTRLATLVRDLAADDSKTLEDKLQEMLEQELESLAAFAELSKDQLNIFVENEKNQGVLKSQSLIKAREKTAKNALDKELDGLLKTKEAEFEAEEAELMAAFGDDDDDWWEDTLTRAVVTEHENDNSEWDILQEDHRKKTVAQKQKQDQELKALDEEFSAEEQKALEVLSKELADKLAVHELKLAQIREELGGNPTDEELAAVLKERALQPLDEFKQGLEKERNMKKTHILQRLEEKHETKARQLKNDHEAQLKDAEQEFLKEKLSLKMMKARKAEVKVLKTTLEQGMVVPEQMGIAIEKAFEMRHASEFTSLIVQQAEEQSNALKKELTGLYDQKNKERLQLMEQLKRNGVDEQGKAQALAALDERFESLRADKNAKLMKDQQQKHFDEQLQLKQEQLQETAAAFKELAPLAVQEEFGILEAKRLANEMQLFTKRLQTDLHADRTDVDADAARMKKEVDEQRKVQAKKEEEELSRKLDARKAQMLAEQERKKAALLAVRDLDNSQREKIMMQFEADKRRIESAIEKERKRQQKRLAKLLEARKKRSKSLTAKETTSSNNNQDTKSTEELMKEIFDNANATESGMTGLGDIKTATAQPGTNANAAAEAAMNKELAQAASEDEVHRIEEKYKAQLKSRDSQIKAEAARRKKQLEDRKAKAKKKREELKDLKARAAAEKDAANKALLEKKAADMENEIMSDTERLKTIEAEFRKSEDTQQATLLAQKKRQRERLKQRREKLKKEKAAKAAEDKADPVKQAMLAKKPEVQSKTLLGRLDNVEKAIRNLLDREMTFNLQGGPHGVNLGGIPSALADKSDILSRLDNLQKTVDDDSEDEEEILAADALSIAPIDLVEVAPVHESKQEAANLEEDLDTRRKSVEQLRAALAAETDPAKRAALQEAIDEEEDKLRDISAAYEKAQAEHDKSVEQQHSSAKEKLRKRREALAAKRKLAANTRAEAKDTIQLKAAQLQNLQFTMAEEIDEERKMELQEELDIASAGLRASEEDVAKKIAAADEDAKRAAADLKQIEVEYERSMDAHAKDLDNELAVKKAHLEARKQARIKARDEKAKAAEVAAKVAVEKEAVAQNVASLKIATSAEKDSVKRQEMEQKLQAEQKKLQEKENEMKAAAVREKAEEDKLHQIESEFNDSNTKYEESVRASRAQQKEKLRLRRERAKHLREQKLAAQQAATDAQLLGAAASNDAVRQELLQVAEMHVKELGSLEEELNTVGANMDEAASAVARNEARQIKELQKDRAATEKALQDRRENVRKKQRVLFKEEDRAATLEQQLASTEDANSRAELKSALEAQQAKVKAQELALQEEELALHQDLAALQRNVVDGRNQQKEQLRLTRERKKGLHQETSQLLQQDVQQLTSQEATLSQVDRLETDAMVLEGDTVGEQLEADLAVAKATDDNDTVSKLEPQVAENNKNVNAAKATKLANKDKPRKLRADNLSEYEREVTSFTNWLRCEDDAIDEQEEKIVAETDASKRQVMIQKLKQNREGFRKAQKQKREELGKVQEKIVKSIESHTSAVQKENQERIAMLKKRRELAKHMHGVFSQLSEQARSAGDSKESAVLAAKAKAHAEKMSVLDKKLAVLDSLDENIANLLEHQTQIQNDESMTQQTCGAKISELSDLIAGTNKSGSLGDTETADASAAAEQVKLAEEQKARLQARLDAERNKVEQLAQSLAATTDEKDKIRLRQQLEAKEARLKQIQGDYSASQEARQKQLEEESALRKEKLRKRREAAKAKKAEIERLRAAGAANTRAEEDALRDLHRDVAQMENEASAVEEASANALEEARNNLQAQTGGGVGAGQTDEEKMKQLKASIANLKTEMVDVANKMADPKMTEADKKKLAEEMEHLKEKVEVQESILNTISIAYNEKKEMEEKARHAKRLHETEKLQQLKDKARQKHEVVVRKNQELQQLLDDLAAAPDEKTKQAIQQAITNKQQDIARSEIAAKEADDEYEAAIQAQENSLAEEKAQQANAMATKQSLLKQHQLEFQKERKAIEEENKRAAKEMAELKAKAAKASAEQKKQIEAQRKAIEERVALKKDAMAARENELKFIKDEFEQATSKHAAVMAAEEVKRKEKLKARRQAMKAKRKKLLEEKARLNAKKTESESLALTEEQLVNKIAVLQAAVAQAEDGNDKIQKQVQLGKLQEQLKELTSQQKQVQQAVADEAKKVEQTSTELETTKEELASSVSKVKSDSKAVSASRREEIRSKQRNIRNLEKELKKKDKMFKELQASGDDPDKAVILRKEMDAINSQIALLGHQLQNLKFNEDMEKLDLAILALEQSNDEVYQKVQAQEAALDVRQKQLGLKRQQLEQMQVALAATTSPKEKAAKQVEIESLERQLQAENTAIDKDLSKVKVQVDSYQKKVDVEFKKRQDVIKRFQGSLNNKKQFLDGISQRLQQAETALANAEGSVDVPPAKIRKLEENIQQLKNSENSLRRVLEENEEQLALAEEDLQDKSRSREEMKQVLLQRERESIRLQKAQQEARKARMAQLEAEAARTTSELEKRALENKLLAEQALQKANDDKLHAEESLLKEQMQQNQNKLRDIEQQFNERKEQEARVVEAEKTSRKAKLKARREALKKKKEKQAKKGGSSKSGASAMVSEEVLAKVAELEEKTAALEAKEAEMAAKQNELMERERRLAALEKKLAAKKKMMALEKSMKAKQMDKRKQEISKKEEELKEIQAKNRAEANRLDSLEAQRAKENERLASQKESLKKLESALANETDDGKKRRMTVQMKKFARNFQSAERKVKRMEEEYNRSLEEHQKKMKAEELRRKDKLRQRREELKNRRARASSNAQRPRTAGPKKSNAPPPPKKRAPPPPAKNDNGSTNVDAMPLIDED